MKYLKMQIVNLLTSATDYSSSQILFHSDNINVNIAA